MRPLSPRGTMGLVDIEGGTEKQHKPGHQGLVSRFSLGTLSQLTGHWQVAWELELVSLPTLGCP